MDFTWLMRKRARGRLEEQLRYLDHADAVQQEQLVRLIEEASLTWQGRRYEYSAIRTYRQFADRVPLVRYEDVRDAVMRMVRGEKDVLWPGVTRHFAQSSGTSDGKSKYIPITAAAFRRNHYAGAADVVNHYLNLNPESRIFSGKGFILGGSFANEVEGLPRGVRVGDLSANLIDNINPIVNLFRVPSKETALLEDWAEKLPRLVEESRRANVTNLSGVPSWFLTVVKEVLKASGRECLHEVWPNLEVFFHGGISFEPYRKQYEALCDMSRMHFLNTYNASEGFFATQSSWDTTAMLLLLDIGVFYEFIPLSESDSDSPAGIVPAWEVEQGRIYELVITACNGLWRYRIGDTVTVESVRPLKIAIAGRTRCFINAFGEELMVHNAEDAIAEACRVTGAEVADYTAAPVYATATTRGRHHWLIEFAKQPDALDTFTDALDKRLRAVNSDYDAKRSGDIFLDPPIITVAPAGLFDRWLAATGKLGGQRKVPRLANTPDLLNTLLAML